MDAAPAPPDRVAKGSPEDLRMRLALFLGGFTTFSLLYCVQPLLPAFADAFSISPPESALALSLSTMTMAVAIVSAGAFSQGLGRRGLMFASMAGASVLNLVAGFASDWPLLLAARALEGLALGGFPAVAMAYVGEEVEPRDLGAAMGLYIAGTAFGGMMGRVGMGVLSEMGSWRAALLVIGAIDLAAAVAFVLLLPPSRRFVRQAGFDPRFHAAAWMGHLKRPAMLALFGCAFALMAVFVTLFNYMGFRLRRPPYGLTETQTSLVFLVYGFGIASAAFTGRLVDAYGERRTLVASFAAMALGALLTLAAPLPAILLGIAFVTVGFFTGHSVASGWVSRLAHDAKGHAASLYLLFYYLGASLIGATGGWAWQHGGWIAVVALTAALSLVGMGLSATFEAESRR